MQNRVTILFHNQNCSCRRFAPLGNCTISADQKKKWGYLETVSPLKEEAWEERGYKNRNARKKTILIEKAALLFAYLFFVLFVLLLLLLFFSLREIFSVVYSSPFSVWRLICFDYPDGLINSGGTEVTSLKKGLWNKAYLAKTRPIYCNGTKSFSYLYLYKFAKRFLNVYKIYIIDQKLK